jgi:Holliday junction resolvase RusA-like endonuclease
MANPLEADPFFAPEEEDGTDPYADDPYAEDPGAPAAELLAEWPDGDPVEVVIPGEPIPWAPAQNNRKTGGRFIPARQANQAARIIDAWRQKGIAPLPKVAPGISRGVVLSFEFYTDRPRSTQYRTGRNAHLLKDQYVGALPTGKPDLTNLIKLFEDALTTHVFADDDQVVRIAGAFKDYGRPRSVMRVWLAPRREEDPRALGQFDPDQPALG